MFKIPSQKITLVKKTVERVSYVRGEGSNRSIPLRDGRKRG
jgi:hypothetical protein